jgi:glucose-1-phosphate cytidylyltransferase
VLEPQVLDVIDGDDTVWEREPVERLAGWGQLMGYRHHGFWSCMDTLKEKTILEELWQSGEPPWRIWTSPQSDTQTARGQSDSLVKA